MASLELELSYDEKSNFSEIIGILSISLQNCLQLFSRHACSK